jgi:hypothetical protein
MSVHARLLVAPVLLAVASLLPAAHAQRADTPPNRRAAAEALFEIPAYRQLATRQMYQAIGQLPEAQRERALAGLSDARIVGAVRDVIVRSSAEVYTVRELEYLARMLSAPEAQTLLEKGQAFEATLARELFTAALTDPELNRLLTAP